MNVGKPILNLLLPQLAGRSLKMDSTESNIKSGFRKTIICPLNTDGFSESDFLPSTVTGKSLLVKDVPEASLSQGMMTILDYILKLRNEKKAIDVENHKKHPIWRS